jgi:hypothetical protein
MTYTAVDYEIDYPESLSRWLWLFKGWLVLPHFIVLAFFAIFISLATTCACWVLLFTGRYPESIFKMVAYYARWHGRVDAYALLLRDEYPPFSGAEDAAYPVRITLKQPMKGDLSRWLWLVKGLLVFPNQIAWLFYAIASTFALQFAGWIILFTGNMPRGLFNFIAGTNYWLFRQQAYSGWGITDDYPPFSGAPSKKID